MAQDLTGDKSTLVQVMAWCRQATCHYLGQIWVIYAAIGVKGHNLSFCKKEYLPHVDISE